MKQETFFRLTIVLVICLLLIVILTPTAVYVVDQRQLAVVLRFGNPVKERTEPGLYFKVPFVERVEKLPSTRQFWGDRQDVLLPDLPTKDDKKIEVIPWAIWRINQPTVFVQRLRTMEEAEQRVAQFTRGAIRDVITQYDLAELVRSTDRPLETSTAGLTEQTADESSGTRRVEMSIKYGRRDILDKIKAEALRRLAAGSGDGESTIGRGIELIDLGISQIEFVASVRTKTFDRWIAERVAISTRNENEGERRKLEIVNRAKAEVQRIEGEGKRQSNELRGEVDAEIIGKYAQAMQEVGEFYAFVRTLEAFENAISTDTRLILTTDSEFFQLLKQLPPTTSAEDPLNVSATGSDDQQTRAE